MAIYHNHVSIISRGKGHSSVGKLAYNHAEKLVDENDGTVYDYSKKMNVQGAEFLRGENCPFENAEQMCQHIEKNEKNPNAQLVREIEFSIPKEYMLADGTITEKGKAVAREYVNAILDKYGMCCADISFHSPPKRIGKNGRRVLAKDSQDNLIFENPHAHIILPTKEWDSEKAQWKNKCQKEYLWTNGVEEIYSTTYPADDKEVFETWAKMQRSRSKTKAGVAEPLFKKALNEKGNVKSRRVEISAWDNDTFVDEVRKLWSDIANKRLREDQIGEISHLSNEDRGIDRLPQIHLKKAEYHDMQVGKSNDNIKKFLAIKDYNAVKTEFENMFNEFLREYSQTKVSLEVVENDEEFIKNRKAYEKWRRDYKWLDDKHDRCVVLEQKLEDLEEKIGNVDNEIVNTGKFIVPKKLREEKLALLDEEKEVKKEKKNIFRDISQRFKTKIVDLADVKELLEKTKRKVDRLAKKLHKPKADEEFSGTPRGKSIADIMAEKKKRVEEQVREQELWEFEQNLKNRRSPNYIQMLTSPAEYEKRKSLRERMEEVEEEFVKTKKQKKEVKKDAPNKKRNGQDYAD